MRILIIDDEQIVLDSVSHILKLNFTDFEIYTARNGKEGLVQLENVRPHIVMTDIRMPGITGIEFIRRARRFDTRVKIIIATAFDQFDYAKEAFRFQIEDYVLKPLTKAKLIELISAVVEKIKREQNRRDIELESIDKLYKSLSIVENNFFHSIINNRAVPHMYSHYRELLGLDFVKGRIVGLEAIGLPDDVNWKQISDYNSRLFDASESFRSAIKLDFDALSSDVMGNKIFGYIETYDEDDLEKLSQLLSGLHDEFINVWGIKVKSVIGPIVEIDQMNESYEAVESLLKHSKEKVSVYSTSELGSYTAADLIAFSEDVFGKVTSLDDKWHMSWTLVERAYLSLTANPMYACEAVDILSLLFMKLVVLFDEEGGNSLSLIQSGKINQFILANEQSKLTLTHNMMDTLVRMLSLGDRNYSEIVSKVMDKIKDCYMEDLTLEGLANEVHVTPQYLSKVFKQDTGITFKTCLTDMRLTKAKVQMISTKDSIKDIAYQVGYNDPNYFVRLFKKVTGFTPGEYQKVMSK
ncbi:MULTISPECIES: response regulator [unclassified Fusibacter]|uniref:response regulator transcription factor n=1 Tax=unclassified Fusibacter TaxID=2624464 RepID=UPI00101354D6|nr:MULTISPECIES: response regulator [unclassified Fusibacter]MCK8059664.1 response regulator [Fusibacter sp. A2]NPE21465.1 response regulator [Fusibacter sp. A1]RXV61876.1 response regulator [Fusibacter sp. A1]